MCMVGKMLVGIQVYVVIYMCTCYYCDSTMDTVAAQPGLGGADELH